MTLLCVPYAHLAHNTVSLVYLLFNRYWTGKDEVIQYVLHSKRVDILEKKIPIRIPKNERSMPFPIMDA